MTRIVLHVFPLRLVLPVLGFLGMDLQAHGGTPPSPDVPAGKRYVLWEPEPAPNRGPDLSPLKPRQAYPYDEDWEKWSYPLGNGTLGANVFGRTDVERIQISEKSFANEGLYGRGGLTNAAELYLEIGHEAGPDYRRELCLNDAIHSVSYRSGGIRFEREYFTSQPDDVLVVRLTADRPGALSMTVRPEIPYVPSREKGNSKTATIHTRGRDIMLTGMIDFFRLRYAIQVRVLHKGGELIAGSKTVAIRNADEVTLLVAVDTNYELKPELFLREPAEKLDSSLDPLPMVSRRIHEAEARGYDALKARHVADHRSLFDRVSIDLGSKVSPLPTHELLDAYKAGGHDTYLEELMFHYGRYLLIASSRPGSLPANLQGAWSQYEVTPWTGGYWHNINVQMNYWGANPTDLAETFEPYIDYFQAYLPKAMEYAQEFMRQRRPDRFSEIPEENGWTFGNGSNAYTLPASVPHSGPGTQAFITVMLMEYYNFTQDREFLREVAYPAMRMLSRFYAKSLIETKDGHLLVENSASPEIKHPWPPPISGGEHYQTVGCTYDQSLVWQNHTDLLRAAEILGIKDDPFLETVRAQIPRLDPIHIGASGQIKEFREENAYGDIGDPHHRHISQLVGLYPGDLIDSSKPEWMNAASRTLDLRGNDTTGWAMAHRMNARARLKEGEKAHEVFRKFISEKTMPNLWSVHPPFQIDGNLGVMSGVAEMLLQSHEEAIEPIPALPKAWNNGSFTGLAARGNFKVSAAWKNGRLRELSVESRSGHPCRLRVPGIAIESVIDERGGSVAFEAETPDVICFPTEKGKTYRVQPETVSLEGEAILVTPKAFKPTLRDVAYGPHERNKLDFWKAGSSKPTPLVFYIHGGGWRAGSKEENDGPSLSLLDKGVSYVSINYRLARGPDTLPCSLHDAARALQFIRSKASEWNIDPDRIIVSGGSAGGCSSLWLAYHDDLADPASSDPVARQSTRVIGAAVIKAQSTIDPRLVDKRLGPSASNHPMIWATVGAPDPQALLNDPEPYEALFTECSPLTHVTRDDPPVFAIYDGGIPAPPERDGIHHAEFGRILKETCEPLGLECTIGLHGKEERQDALDAFIMRRFREGRIER
ncbi:MAG: glycoside hydrolase N-terminal domain-containing protein [Verrucomicrobiae bacterium]|nr:glycoside hydrolase N-terminal domain-containing protein [Verrucomicrobiae bacterium]